LPVILNPVRRCVDKVKRHKDFFLPLQPLATIAALLVGATWTYTLTKQFRETQPKLTIKQEVSNWALADGSTLIRVDSILTNSSKFQIKGVKGRMIVLRILPETKEQAEQYRAGKIYFPCINSAGAPIPICVPEKGLNLPAASRHVFPINELAGYLEPGESTPYWRYLQLDKDVQVVEVFTAIEKPGTQGGNWIFDSVFTLKR